MHAANGTDRMKIDMSTLLPGFADVVHDSQAVFRALLDALARPGSIVSVDAALAEAAPHGRVQRAAFASLLALADYSTPVHLPDDDRALGDAVRFHTGAPLTADPAQAVFAYLSDARTMPALDTFALGEPESPESAATLFIQVDSLDEGPPLTWRGPGIRESRTVAIGGLPPRFWQERAALAPLFPCGIDCYFVAGGSLVGLPRTTHVEVS